MPNHCTAGGDTGAACTDAVAPATGYSCKCDPGFQSNGASCVNACNATSNPCGAGRGTCAVHGSGWSCACGAGFSSSGGSNPTCVDLNACTVAAKSSCQVVGGNTCVDEVAPSTTFHCSCGAGYTGSGTHACVDKDECIPHHCSDGGDTGPSVACVDAIAPATGYRCNCDAGFAFNGVTCLR